MNELSRNEAPYKSIDECMMRRSVTSELLKWSVLVKRVGICLLIAILLYGIIVSYTAANVEVESFSRTRTEFDSGIFLESIVLYCFDAFIVFCVYKLISVLLSALSGIYQHTAETAALKEYELLNKENKNQ